ncbi:hypothetical protein RI129_006785 [Pyrocoelia pectoralis]|uniref:Uncharacterized protein n=1 Tax=Pyrocoelia pectoralis TaxID=417401 RepID=A0AAN7ZGF4_9COLE
MSRCSRFEGVAAANTSLDNFKNESSRYKYNSQELLETCFGAWHLYITNKKNMKNEKGEQGKLGDFIKLLKKYQNPKVFPTLAKKNESKNLFHNRFKAQEKIIEIQKHKLIRQQKMIEQLKLGNIYDAIDESLKKSNTDIKEIFGNCPGKLKSAPLLNDINKDVKFAINSNKAPKIIKEMGQRALNRESKRQLIREKKRTIDEIKKRTLEEELAQKKTQDEDERRRQMKLMKKRRKAQLEFHRAAKAKREKYLKDCVKADFFYKNSQKRAVFRMLEKLIVIKEQKFVKSAHFYETTLKQTGMRRWKVFVEVTHEKRTRKAVQFHNFKMKTASFHLWFKLHILHVQQSQVAEDFYLMQLEKRVFHHFHKYTCIQYMLEIKNTQKAERHYKSRILIHYFYQWKSFPAIMVIERAKEEKKRKWREKVWEILPDYKPVLDNSL